VIGAWERRSERLAPFNVFLGRLAHSLVVVLGFVGVSLAVGMAGYAGFERMGWVDAFENASMILSGMGPVEGMHTDAGKVFAGLYAIFSGIVVIASTSVMLAPILHRVMHSFHVPDDDDAAPARPTGRRRR
jgi:hypothetical protein